VREIIFIILGIRDRLCAVNERKIFDNFLLDYMIIYSYIRLDLWRLEIMKKNYVSPESASGPQIYHLPLIPFFMEALR
jgi:hypothetical protein